MKRPFWQPWVVVLGSLGCSLVQAQSSSVLWPWRLESGLTLSTTLGGLVSAQAASPVRSSAARLQEEQSKLALIFSYDLLDSTGVAALGADQLLHQARNWLVHGRLDLARQNLEKMLQVTPDAPQALAELGHIALQENNLSEAQRMLQRLRQRYPRSQATHDLETLLRVFGPDQETLARMRLLARAGRQKDAAEIARSLFPEGPPQTGTLGPEYFRIMAGAQSGMSQAAHTRRAVDALYARTKDAQYRLVALEMEQARGAPAPALALAVEQLAQDPGVDMYRLRDLWRRVLERLEPSVLAQRRLQAYLRRYPEDALVRGLLREASDPARLALAAAQQALDTDQLAQAETWAHKALRLRPQYPEGLGVLGWVRLRQSRYLEAQQLLSKAMQGSDEQRWRDLLVTARWWGLLHQAEAARDAGQWDRAAALLEQALREQPGNTVALSSLAQIRVAQGDSATAQRLYEQVLALEPGYPGALRGLVGLLVQAQRLTAAMAVLDTPANALPNDPDNQALRHALRADVLALQSEKLLQEQRLGPALRLLEEAVGLTPANPWLRHRLARTYLQLAQPSEALLVMDEGMTQVQGGHSTKMPEMPEMAEMRFARALIRSATNDHAGAVQDVQRIPEAQRTPAMQALLQSSQVQHLLAQTQTRGADVALLLQQAESVAADDTDLLWAVANAWLDREVPERGVAVLERFMARRGGPEQLPVAVRLDYAALLSRAQMDGRLSQVLPALQALPAWDASQGQQLARIAAQHRERAVETLAAAGKVTQAQTLAQTPLWGQTYLSVAEGGLLKGRVRLAAQDWLGAQQALEPAVQLQPDDVRLRLTLGDAYARQGLTQQAYAQALWLQQHLPPEGKADLLALLRLLQRIPALEVAHALAQQLLQNFPNDTQVLLHAARLERAQDRYAQALEYFRAAHTQDSNSAETNADIAQNIAAIEARRQAWVETGVVRISKNATEGISSLHGYEVPMVAWMPKGYDGHHFLHVDRVQLYAGNLPQSRDIAQGYGQVAAWPASAYPGAPWTPRGQGANVGVGYRGTGVEWDIGLMGIGMPVTNVVGSVSYGEWREDLNYRMEFARRPITGSLLSYAGAHDPITGQVWGGVVATGIGGRIGKPFGSYSASLSGSYALLQGKHVQNNTRLQLRAAVDRDIWKNSTSSVNVGAALSFWRYGKDLSEYSWGHGGYYSPKSYLSLSLPVEWGGRHAKLSWLARGALSFSRSSSAASFYYPGDVGLQAQALRQGYQPVYAAGRGTGMGRSLRGVVEYQFTPNLALGAQLSLDRSAYYAPTNMLFYLRWMIDPVRAQRSERPRPVQAYSDF